VTVTPGTCQRYALNKRSGRVHCIVAAADTEDDPLGEALDTVYTRCGQVLFLSHADYGHGQGREIADFEPGQLCRRCAGTAR
jgi:hypothetical protein